MITTIIHNSKFIIHNYDYHCWKNIQLEYQGLKHKSKSSMFKVQNSKDKKKQGLKHKSKSSKFKAQSSKDKKFKG